MPKYTIQSLPSIDTIPPYVLKKCLRQAKVTAEAARQEIKAAAKVWLSYHLYLKYMAWSIPSEWPEMKYEYWDIIEGVLPKEERKAVFGKG
jgi:hypothetical protein